MDTLLGFFCSAGWQPHCQAFVVQAQDRRKQEQTHPASSRFLGVEKFRSRHKVTVLAEQLQLWFEPYLKHQSWFYPYQLEQIEQIEGIGALPWLNSITRAKTNCNAMNLLLL